MAQNRNGNQKPPSGRAGTLSCQLYLHIGYPKTGTTFLQQALFPHAQGMNFIRNSVAEELDMIAHQDHLNFNPDAVKTSLEKHFRSGKNLISNESLLGNFYVFKSINNTMIADRLKLLFPNAKIIITIRNQYDLIESLYKQYLHRGGVKKFRDFANFKNGGFNAAYNGWSFSVHITLFDYLKLVQYYENLFGKENTFLIPYELLRKDPQLFAQKLFSWMEVGEIPNFKSEFYNQGYGAAQVRIARFFNRFLKSKFNEEPIIPDVCLPITGKIDVGKLRRVLQSPLSRKLLGAKPITDFEMKGQVQKFFEKSNRQMNERYSLLLDQICPGEYFE